IQSFYGKPGRPRAKALATPGLDEDPLTMAYEAGREALADGAEPGAVIAVTQSPPFGLRKVSQTLARALGLDERPRCYDVGGHAAVGALKALEGAAGRPVGDCAQVCPSQPHPQVLRALARAGVQDEQIARTTFVGEIGNLGAASVGLALALGLDAAEAGQ